MPNLSQYASRPNVGCGIALACILALSFVLIAATLSVQGISRVVVSKFSKTPDIVHQGEKIRLGITLKNEGDKAANNVEIAISSTGLTIKDGQRSIGSLGVGKESVELTFDADVKTDALNWANVTVFTKYDGSPGPGDTEPIPVRTFAYKVSEFSPNQVKQGEEKETTATVNVDKPGYAVFDMKFKVDYDQTAFILLKKPADYPSLTAASISGEEVTLKTLKDAKKANYKLNVTLEFKDEKQNPHSFTAVRTFGITDCLIATAAYGSWIAPQVQLLRDYRDQKILRSFAGGAFMTGFNRWYYSFSHVLATIIAGHELLKSLTRITLYPLIVALQTSELLYDAVGSSSIEVRTTGSGLLASGLIGIFYLFPLLIAVYVCERGRVSFLRSNKKVSRSASVTDYALCSDASAVPYAWIKARFFSNSSLTGARNRKTKCD